MQQDGVGGYCKLIFSEGVEVKRAIKSLLLTPAQQHQPSLLCPPPDDKATTSTPLQSDLPKS